jgi:hypothetical protein
MAVDPALARSITRRHRPGEVNARLLLGTILLLAIALFGCWLVGTRSLDTGTDTETYAGFYERLDQGLPETRLEPGFVYLSYALRNAGVDLVGYQMALFALMLLTVFLATRNYHRFLGEARGSRGFQTLLCASLLLLFVSPMFVNASINAIRQGLAALLIFAALLNFHERRWWPFAIYGAVATSLHFSSLLYLLCAPALLLSARNLRVVAALVFLAYVSGASMIAVRAAAPSLYATVMEYTANPNYRSGVRIDFAVFTIFWYALANALAPLVKEPFRQRLIDSTAVYLVMALPFFVIGWGFFSNRYLLPAWLAGSLIFAAIACYNRIALLRNALLIRVGLLASCGAFYLYVSRGIVI